MGHLNAFNIPQLINDFKLSHYVETGTGEGLTLSQALTFNFKSLHSIEIDKYMYDLIIQKFIDPRLNLHLGLSRDVLPQILSKLKGENILFFLDAHFPGSDFRTGPGYIESVSLYGHDALPLRDELEIILKIRSESKDVFIVDDLRIYEDDNYETGNWKERKNLNIENSSFVYDLLKKTHSIQVDLKQQGYLLIKPL
jgi:hypothetical protein